MRCNFGIKKIFIGFIFTCYVGFSQNLDDLQFGTSNTLDIVSWNIEWFPKNSNTPQYVHEILLNLDANIYALQEIQDTTLLKQIVSKIPNYECYFKSSYYAGLAYVYDSSTIEINSVYEIYTSEPYWNPFPRSPLIIDFNYEGAQYIVINNHFKCCGDGILELDNSYDEENRRLQAMNYLKEYIDDNFSNTNVILTGDLNDNLDDNLQNNVFQTVLNDNLDYLFVDMPIAQGSSLNWSYPSWPSHLDHMLINNPIFDDFQNSNSYVSVIRIDDYMGGWNNYDNNVTDHRPIALKLDISSVGINSDSKPFQKKIVKTVNILGSEISTNTSGLVIEIFDDGSVDFKYKLF